MFGMKYVEFLSKTTLKCIQITKPLPSGFLNTENDHLS